MYLGESFKIDIFCRVIDNYGDIAVTWRLARQLSQEHKLQIRVIVDDLKTFRKIEPKVDERKPQQKIENIVILKWDDDTLTSSYDKAGDCVIEMLACSLPDIVIQKMLQNKLPSVWVDVEYLCAEKWVDVYHAIPSQHPTLPLKKTLFFPGFTNKTGGLYREKGLQQKRDLFQGNLVQQNEWRKATGLPPKAESFKDVSIFCYPSAPLSTLANVSMRLFAPEEIAPVLKNSTHLPVFSFPFLSQSDYDQLLWTCDLNFVRGEDSWLRAIWAGKPFMWQIYEQQNGAHLAKLKAFLNLYTQGLDTESAELLADFHAMWNEGGREGKTESGLWDSLLSLLPHLKDHALRWSCAQAEIDDCATQLTRFIREQTTLNVTG